MSTVLGPSFKFHHAWPNGGKRQVPGDGLEIKVAAGRTFRKKMEIILASDGTLQER